MEVTAINVFISATEDRRGRICRRPDGRFQFVTEQLIPEDDECLAYWRNDHPPSGIFETRDAAIAALHREIASLVPWENVRPVTFDLRVGPYPEPSASAPPPSAAKH
jgi:hypothetical protein